MILKCNWCSKGSKLPVILSVNDVVVRFCGIEHLIEYVKSNYMKQVTEVFNKNEQMTLEEGVDPEYIDDNMTSMLSIDKSEDERGIDNANNN